MILDATAEAGVPLQSETLIGGTVQGIKEGLKGIQVMAECRGRGGRGGA